MREQLGTTTLKGFGLEEGEPAIQAAAAALQYAQETQRNDLGHVRGVRLGETSRHMVLDAVTVANLEVFENLRDRRKKGSLLWVLDRTVTAGVKIRFRQVYPNCRQMSSISSSWRNSTRAVT